MVGPGKFDAVIPKPISVSDIKQVIAHYSSGQLPLKLSDDSKLDTSTDTSGESVTF
jgi:hypothetical protein